MVSEDTASHTPQPEKDQENEKLPVDFFQTLLGLPPCKLGKPCNDCGKCEH